MIHNETITIWNTHTHTHTHTHLNIYFLERFLEIFGILQIINVNLNQTEGITEIFLKRWQLAEIVKTIKSFVHFH